MIKTLKVLGMFLLWLLITVIVPGVIPAVVTIAFAAALGITHIFTAAHAIAHGKTKPYNKKELNVALFAHSPLVFYGILGLFSAYTFIGTLLVPSLLFLVSYVVLHKTYKGTSL